MTCPVYTEAKRQHAEGHCASLPIDETSEGVWICDENWRWLKSFANYEAAAKYRTKAIDRALNQFFRKAA